MPGLPAKIVGLAFRRADGTRDHEPVRVEVDADLRRGAVVLIVAEHELELALLDLVPLAGVKGRLVPSGLA